MMRLPVERAEALRQAFSPTVLGHTVVCPQCVKRDAKHFPNGIFFRPRILQCYIAFCDM